MGKKTPSPSSESVSTMCSVPGEMEESMDQSIVSEADTTISTDGNAGDKSAKKEKLGLIKRMSLRREKKKDKEKEKQAEKEKAKEEKEKAKEEKEKAKLEKEKSKSKNKSKDEGIDKKDEKAKDEKGKDKEKSKEKTKDKGKDKRKEEGGKNTVDKIYRKISMDDFEEKQTEFKLWMLEQQHGSVDGMKASKVKSFFKKFVKEWNKKNLPHRYYWTSEETPPPSRAGSRFSFAEEPQTPDFLNFPAAPVDLSNDDLDSEDGIERSGSFSTFGKTQKPEGLNDEVTPTMPKRPLLSAVFPNADSSTERVSPMGNRPLFICEDVSTSNSDPPTPTPETSPSGPMVPPPVLLNYEQSPGLINGELKERYIISPDNNNIRKISDTTVIRTQQVETSNYICMEDNVLPGEELQVTQMLEKALQGEGLQPSGELTPITEEESQQRESKHTISHTTVVAALQPVAESQMRANSEQDKHNGAVLTEAVVDTSWKVVSSEEENGQVTFSGLPPPPKEWKRDSGLTQTILPPVRSVSYEKANSPTEVKTPPPVIAYKQNEVVEVTKTTITTVENVTESSNSVTVSASDAVVSPSVSVVKREVTYIPEGPPLTVSSQKIEGKSPTISSPPFFTQELKSPTIKTPPPVMLVMPETKSPTLVTPPVQESKSSSAYGNKTVVETKTITSATSPIMLVTEEGKSPEVKREIIVEHTSRNIVEPAASPMDSSNRVIPDTVTIHQKSVSIPATSHVTLSQQQLQSPAKQTTLVQESRGTTEYKQHFEPNVIVYSPSKETVENRNPLVSNIASTANVSYRPQPDPMPAVHRLVSEQTPIMHQTNETTTIVFQPTNMTNGQRRSTEVIDHPGMTTSTTISSGAISPTLAVPENETIETATNVAQPNVLRRSTEAIHHPNMAASPTSPSVDVFQPTIITSVHRRSTEVIHHPGMVSPTSTKPAVDGNTQDSKRKSLELKHVESSEIITHEKRGPHLSPLIVSASTVPMLFQEALRPKEIPLDQDHSKPIEGAHMRSPRTPEKPKPAPRPKSFKSPTSPSSRIPVAVHGESSQGTAAVSPTKPARQESFKSSRTLVMATSPTGPPTSVVTSPRKPTVAPPSHVATSHPKLPVSSPPKPVVTSPPRHLAASPPRHLATSPPKHAATSPPKHAATSPRKPDKIPPPKAPRPDRSPLSPPANSVLYTDTNPISEAPVANTSSQSHIVIQRESATRSLKPTSAVFSSDRPSSTNQPSYSKFMYEQPSFVGSRADTGRRSMSRINFAPPKPAPKPRPTTSYTEAQHFTFDNQPPPVSNQSRIPKSHSDYSVHTRQTRLSSYTEESPAKEDISHREYQPETEAEFDDSLVRPEQTRTTFGPTFMRLAGDRRSLSRIERTQYSPKVPEPRVEQNQSRQDSHIEQSNPFRNDRVYRPVSTGSESNLDPASNIVNRYLMEIKENTELISVPNNEQSKSAENLTSVETEGVQLGRSEGGTYDSHKVVQTTRVSHSHLPIYGTSAYKENEHLIGSRPVSVGAPPRQSATLPRNYKGVSMGAVVVEMGAGHPARVNTSPRNSYVVQNNLQTPGDRRSFAGHESSPDLHTPGSRSSYAGFTPARQPTSPGYAHSGYMVTKNIQTPRSRSSYAGTSQTSLTPEELARLQEVLRR